jgi:hypothetical protein
MNTTSRGLFVLSLLAAVGLASGCSHSLEVTNLDQYQVRTANTLEKSLSMGIRAVGQPDMKMLVGIAEQLSTYQARVKMPHLGSRKTVDVVAAIGIDSEYSGSGWNFLINFPGFLIFAPLWHGYHYEVSHTINVQLARGADGEEIDRFSIPIVLDVRHADIGRTWTEVSWFEVGAIAFIGGIVFIGYDDDVTPILADKAGVENGDVFWDSWSLKYYYWDGTKPEVRPPWGSTRANF